VAVAASTVVAEEGSVAVVDSTVVEAFTAADSTAEADTAVVTDNRFSCAGAFAPRIANASENIPSSLAFSFKSWISNADAFRDGFCDRSLAT
jgi:hypothetical protein